MKNRFVYLIAFGFVALFSCKKVVDKIKGDLISDFITDGRWIVSNFSEGSNVLTPEYAAYECQFNDNNTATIIQTGSPDVTGTFLTNTSNLTITCNFPVTTNPLVRMNGVWLVTNYSTTSVQATRTVNGVVLTMGLRKK